MHILAASSASLDELIEPIDLDQQPADIVVLSFSDSDLAGLAQSWQAKRENDPDFSSLRLASLRDLRHPMSVDIWIDKVAQHAKVILVRILGGYDWWRYGCEELARVARARGVHLIMLPGECRETDRKLEACSTLPVEKLSALLAYFREGGPENMGRLMRAMDALAKNCVQEAEPASEVGRVGFYGEYEKCSAYPRVAVLFYRSILLASDTAPIDALLETLRARELEPVAIYVSSLRDEEACQFVETELHALKPAAIITATAFASSIDTSGPGLFDRLGVPVFQAIIATTRQEAWAENQRGLAPADLAMHVVLPELDGRILAGALSFKGAQEDDRDLGFRPMVNVAVADRINALVDRVESSIRLQKTTRGDRKIIILMPDYPGSPGHTGYAVGLDVPQSVIEILRSLRAEGYRVDEIPATARDLLDLLDHPEATLSQADYQKHFLRLSSKMQAAVRGAWEDERQDHTFRAVSFGNVTVALAPDRGRNADRRSDYHDPFLPPHPSLLAFGFYLQHSLQAQAIVHVGAHGTLEWLPGKTVALSKDCFPEEITGKLPVIYPFIVSNPGEAAVAKRRIAAVTLGHLPPVLEGAGLSQAEQKLERLVDEYAQAEGLDGRRRDRLAREIITTAKETGLAKTAGVMESDDPDTALTRIDAWLCDVKDFAIKDGQHVYGTVLSSDTDPLRVLSASTERNALIDALDGKHVRPGPSGAPSRGRRDVMPTGRNLYASDPRTMPTRTAYDLGTRASEEVLRRYLQDHGEWPKSLIIDLWGSASLRTGGEEIAQGLWLMGAKPAWDPATGRVTGIEIMPCAVLGRPRVDVTFRISGLFRDMFGATIALIDAATRAVAARDEAEDENPLAAIAKREGHIPARVFGAKPGVYGAGVEDILTFGTWTDRSEIADAYLTAADYAFGGAEGESLGRSETFAAQVAAAQILIHTADDPGRDILEGSADAAFIGGFATAMEKLGSTADLITLDTTNPDRPRARLLKETIALVVKARATNPRFIAGQMRHGPRGAAEFAETVDRLVSFGETTGQVGEDLIAALYEAYVANDAVRKFMLEQNPKAAAHIACRFEDAIKRGLWHPLRNSVIADLESLLGSELKPEASAR